MTTEKCIPLHILEKITNGFSADSIIGTGGYGNVYKGVYNERQIAVKLLHVDTLRGLDDQQFKNEVGNLLRAEHPNIVHLVGYCYETKKIYVERNGRNDFSERIYRVLCFEYLQGGSLDKQVYGQSFAPKWSTRYKIIKGVCEGLNFLHKCDPQILHLDLKPANILLDSYMQPKVADFGLSRLFTQSYTHVTDRIIGSRKYMPPEFETKGMISSKNDVFSLGVVMIEIMTEPAGYSNSFEMGYVAQLSQQVLTHWSTVIEATSKYPSQEMHQLQICIELAIHCVDSERDNRPTTADILHALNKTEANIPKRQLADVLSCSTIGPKNTMANTLKTMAAELDNISNQNQHVSSVQDKSSIMPEVLRETASDVEESLIIGRTKEKQKIVATLCGIIPPEIRDIFTSDPSPGFCLCLSIPFYHELSLLYTIFVSNFSKMVNWDSGPQADAQVVIGVVDPPLPKITVLPIYGIGGIGKTTLAQLVFNDSEFTDHSRVWVHMPEIFDLNNIGNSIISQLSKEISHLAERQMIHRKLSELLSGKKILIVLDDLWEKNPDRIKTLKAMLRLGAGSMVTVIVTTRDEAIAREVCHSVEPYKLETLTDKMCWKIIKQKTSFKDRVDKWQLKHIGREIATKCGGVALAAQSLGYTLNGRTSDEWESVRDNYMWNLCTSDELSSISQEVLLSLLLSYSRMPDWLKLCFSYCAIFPKGHLIPKYYLIHLWIALGFTEQSSIFDSMQLCEKYITELLGMSFLQYSTTQSPVLLQQCDGGQDEDVIMFTMHSLVHDLAKAILAHQVNNKGNAGGDICRYALLTDCSKPLQLSVSSPADLKALHFLDCGKIELRGDAFSPAECLHVLDLSECFIQKLPNSIGQMKHLRFLHAPRIQDQMIPSCITKLSELTYLNLRGSRKISALPESIGDIKVLMHLDLSGCVGICELPISFAELKQLVHLDLSHCHMSTSEYFGGFTKLRYLNLSHCHMPIRGLPEGIANLLKLRYLNLSGLMAPSEDQFNSLLGSISTLSNLEHLNLSKNRDLTSLPESTGNLRKLHTLNLSGCFELQSLPSSMDKMVSLKLVILTSWFRLPLPLNFATLPTFVVHASSDYCSSNISLLQPTNPDKLDIQRLENVKSAKEAQSIRLINKDNIKDLTFRWTVAADRFVFDEEVLEKLVPPSSVQEMVITGYRGRTLPDWLMDIRQYLPNLLKIDLLSFSSCIELPPLGQLPNLRWLGLCRMKSLEDWNTICSTVEGVNELLFPRLETLKIKKCGKLGIKPCLPRAKSLRIESCDNFLSSWGESSSHRHSGVSSSYSIISLNVEKCKVPLHQWRLLHQLPALRILTINRCSDLTTSPEIIQQLCSLQSLTLDFLQLSLVPKALLAELPRWVVELTSLCSLKLRGCNSMTSLPQWLGELTSLKILEIGNCTGIRSLPDSIQQLTNLECLIIERCPALKEWCESEDNNMKLAHIREKLFR